MAQYYLVLLYKPKPCVWKNIHVCDANVQVYDGQIQFLDGQSSCLMRNCTCLMTNSRVVNSQNHIFCIRTRTQFLNWVSQWVNHENLFWLNHHTRRSWSQSHPKSSGLHVSRVRVGSPVALEVPTKWSTSCMETYLVYLI